MLIILRLGLDGHPLEHFSSWRRPYYTGGPKSVDSGSYEYFQIKQGEKWLKCPELYLIFLHKQQKLSKSTPSISKKDIFEILGFINNFLISNDCGLWLKYNNICDLIFGDIQFWLLKLFKNHLGSNLTSDLYGINRVIFQYLWHHHYLYR